MRKELIKAVLVDGDNIDLKLNGSTAEIMSAINIIVGSLADESGMGVQYLYDKLASVHALAIEAKKNERV